MIFIFNKNNKNLIQKSAGYLSKLLFAILFFCFSGCERPTDVNQKDDGVPPAVPIGLYVIFATDGEILIEWLNNSDADLAGYNIYRKVDTLQYVLFGFTKSNYLFDDSLNYDEQYFYKIAAVDIWGNESQTSAEVSAVPINRYPPQKIRFSSINARNWEGNKYFFLSWIPNKESDVHGFNIYRSIDQNFAADSSHLIGFTTNLEYIDSIDIELYKNYHYKLRAVDKGGLISDESSRLTDLVYGIAQPISPMDDYFGSYFNTFTIKTISVPADYQIIVQTNQYFGEFWSKKFSSVITDDTVMINFDPKFLDSFVYYYWRIITYSNDNAEPNSISPLYKFMLKP
jgi:hypothetical protein